jgi:hypothetical protein
VAAQNELSFDFSVLDPGWPLLPLSFVLDAQSLAAGMTVDQDGHFSWTPANHQGSREHSVSITLYAGGAGEPVMVVQDSFEEADVGAPLNTLAGWSGSGSITTDPSGPSGYLGTLPLPEATHSKTLKIVSEATREAVANDIATVDMMLQPTFGGIPTDGETHSSISFTEEGHLRVKHCVPDGAGYTAILSVVELPTPLSEGDWVRLGVIVDYKTSDPPNPMFQVLVNGTALTHATALQEPNISCAQTGGTWFIGTSGQTVGNGAATRLNTVELAGNSVIDDVVVRGLGPAGLSDTKSFNITVTGGGIVDSDGDGIPDDWEIAHGLNPNSADDAALDSDGDGFTNLQEYIAGTDPTDANSFFRADEVKAGDATVGLKFRSVEGRVYGVERRDSLESGSWSTLATGIPGTGEIIEVTDPNPAPDARFYRLTVALP